MNLIDADGYDQAVRVIEDLTKVNIGKRIILSRVWTSVGHFGERFYCFFKSFVPTQRGFGRALIGDVACGFDGFVARFFSEYDLVPHDLILAFVVNAKALANVGEYFACGHARCSVAD